MYTVLKKNYKYGCQVKLVVFMFKERVKRRIVHPPTPTKNPVLKSLSYNKHV